MPALAHRSLRSSAVARLLAVTVLLGCAQSLDHAQAHAGDSGGYGAPTVVGGIAVGAVMVFGLAQAVVSGVQVARDRPASVGGYVLGGLNLVSAAVLTLMAAKGDNRLFGVALGQLGVGGLDVGLTLWARDTARAEPAPRVGLAPSFALDAAGRIAPGLALCLRAF